MIFGQLGDDTIQGDGSIDDRPASRGVRATRPATSCSTRRSRRRPTATTTSRATAATTSSSATSARTTSSAAARACSRLIDDGAAARRRRPHLRRRRHRRRPQRRRPPVARPRRRHDRRRQRQHLPARDASSRRRDAPTAPSTTTTTAPRQASGSSRGPSRLLDYTPGGPDFAPSRRSTSDVGGADEIHGESGDDFIYGGGGQRRRSSATPGRRPDRRLGPRLDLRRHRRRRHPRRRRPHLHQPQRQHRAAERRDHREHRRSRVATPGRAQVAILIPTGQLNKSVDLTPFAVGWTTSANPLNPIGVRQRRALRRLGRRLHPRRVRRRRDLGCRGAGDVVLGDVRTRGGRGTGWDRRRRDAAGTGRSTTARCSASTRPRGSSPSTTSTTRCARSS